MIIKRQKNFGRWADLLYKGASRLLDSTEGNSSKPASLYEEVNELYKDNDGDSPDSEYEVKEIFISDLRITPKHRTIDYIDIDDWRKELDPLKYPELFKALSNSKKVIAKL